MKKLLSLLILISFTFKTGAEIKLSPIFSDNMVLQQKSSTKIWGTADAGKLVTISPSWDKLRYTAQADNNGKWSVKIETPSYGGPYSITVTDGKKDKIVLENVMIGEVWLCGGQSNMELSMSDGIIGAAVDMKEVSGNSNIRILHIANAQSRDEAENPTLVGDGWRTCEGNDLEKFSATAFYFGRELSRNLDIPVGLIESCWGGSRIEPWISRESVNLAPATASEMLSPDDEFDEESFEEKMEKWDKALSGHCASMNDGKALWAAKKLDESSWAEINVPGTIEEQGFDFNGIFWLRKTIDIPKEWEGKKLTLNLNAIDDYDYTYFNGVCVGHEEGYTTKRVYTVPAKLVKAGKAVIAIRIFDIEGEGGIYCDKGLISIGPDRDNTIKLDGRWKLRLDITDDMVPAMPQSRLSYFTTPCLMYNAMISPLVGYAIKGAIWYQGCSNVDQAEEYNTLMPLLIYDWRSKWGYDFPFYITQLANYLKVQTGAEESDWALLREAQSQTAANVAGSGLAVLIDVGEADDIHPKNKYDVGKRLALNALAKEYGKHVIYSGPTFEDYTIEGNSIRVRFSHCDGGLKTADYIYKEFRPEFKISKVEGFYIAGPDHIFHKAEAVIDGDSVIVSSSEVVCPIAVRYAWANNPVCNLYNGAGLPAVPFRTDSWPLRKR